MAPATRGRLIEQILVHLQLLGTEVDRLTGAAASFNRLNRTDLRALQVLRTGAGMTAGELSRALNVTSGATTRVIDSLVAGGHLLREADPTDRRHVLVRLTPEAAAIVDRTFERLRADARDLLETYGDAELETAERVLADARSLIRAHARRLAGSADR